MDTSTTVIDAQADIEGTLKGKDVQVLGRFRGEIELTGRLAMGEGARVEAKVVADTVEIAGEFKGELKARTLSLLEKGRLEGTVDTQRLIVREGALLNGSVNTADGRPAAPTRASMTGLATG
ncbi:MAG TPA: polymer-forming cytoskeletal protein [Vicinamibacteria bacterium]|nr:polymer-forming cytoskeletal protein [Vicinamibacteria bacterium]